MSDTMTYPRLMRSRRERAALRGEIAHLKAALHATDVARLGAIDRFDALALFALLVVANARIVPDPTMADATDVALVPLDDIWRLCSALNAREVPAPAFAEVADLQAALHATDVARLHAEREAAIMRDTANLLMDRIEDE